MESQSDGYPLNLSQAQRRVIAEILPHLGPRLKLDESAQRTLRFPLDELKVIRELAAASMASARTGMIRNSLRHVADFARRAVEDAAGVGTIPKLERMYQFKITLRNSQPPIWRRIQIRDCTLDKLHEHIQTAMGWRNCHLNHFRVGDRRYGDPELLYENFAEFDYEYSTCTKLSSILPKSGERFQFEYEYDFGDSWYHDVLFEGCVRAERGIQYPICVEGARACPPEDVGGLMGYREFLEAIADADHERHDEFLTWIGGSFDPEAFDVDRLTKRMRRGLPNWRRMDA